MSDNAHGYQTEVPVEQVSHQDVSNAIDEKLIEQSKTLTGNDVEAQQALEASEAENSQTENNEAENDEFSSKFAALSRREKQMRERERQIEEKINELNAKMEALNAPQEVEEPSEPELPFEYRFRRDPIKTMEEAGISYEELTKIVLNDGELPTEMKLKLMGEDIKSETQKRIEELENKLLEKEKQEAERDFEQQINSFKQGINDFVNSSENYELIQANEAHDLVYDVIEEHYKDTNEILETSVAADHVEQYLEEELKTVLKKSKKLGNWKPEVEKQPTEEKRQSPTLSNSLAARGIESNADRKLSREESLAKLSAEFGNKLWQD